MATSPPVPTSIASAEPTTVRSIRQLELLRAGWKRLFGYDFFIAYAWKDSRAYAATLAELLSSSDYRYRCFIDNKEMGGGAEWRTSVKKALRRTSVLILIATPAALTSDFVFEEVQEFIKRKRPIVPIVFESALVPANHRLYQVLKDRIHFEESTGNKFSAGAPSQAVVRYLNDSFGFTRVDRVRTWILVSLSITFFGLAVLAFDQFLAERTATFVAQRQTKVAQDQTRLANQQRNIATGELARAQIAQSRFLSEEAQKQLDDSNVGIATAITLEALPDNLGGAKALSRPIVSGAVSTLYNAMAVDTLLGEIKTNLDATTKTNLATDGSHIVSAKSNYDVVVWDARIGAEVLVLQGHTEHVRTARFDTTGERIVTASWDGTARIWNSLTGTPIAILSGHKAVNDAAFSRPLRSWFQRGLAGEGAGYRDQD